MQKNEIIVQKVHMSRTTKFKLQDYVKALKDSKNDLRAASADHLSPNAKLRIL